MKNLIFILSIFVCTSVFAQKISKEEKQALLLEIKALKKSPEKLKNLKESVEVRDVIINQQNEELAELKKDAQKNDLALKEVKDSLKTVKSELADLDYRNVPVHNGFNLPSTTTNAPLDHAGYKYRVQIGVFQNFDITHLFDEPKYIVHELVNGMHRYSVGNFVSEADANAFKKEMKRMGLKDAFVTTYEDGYRLGDPRPNPIVNTVAPLDEPAPVVEVNRGGFNVKPAKTVVETPAPVQIDTKDLNDKINVEPTVTTTTTTTTTTPVVGEQKVEERETKIEVPENEVKVKPKGEEFLFRDTNSDSKSNGIKINVGK